MEIKVTRQVPLYITVNIGDGANLITTGVKGYTPPLPFGATIMSWSIAETSELPLNSSITVDITKCARVAYPPTVSIAGTQPPSLSVQKTNIETNLTTWDTSIDQYDCLGFNVTFTDSVAKKLSIVIRLERK